MPGHRPDGRETVARRSDFWYDRKKKGGAGHEAGQAAAGPPGGPPGRGVSLPPHARPQGERGPGPLPEDPGGGAGHHGAPRLRRPPRPGGGPGGEHGPGGPALRQWGDPVPGQRLHRGPAGGGPGGHPAGRQGPGGPALPQGGVPRRRALRPGPGVAGPAHGGGLRRGGVHSALPGGAGPDGPPGDKTSCLPQPHLRRRPQRHGGHLRRGPCQGGARVGGRGPRGPSGADRGLPPWGCGPGGGPGGGLPPQDAPQPHPDRRPPPQRGPGGPGRGPAAGGDLPVQQSVLPAHGGYGRLRPAAGGEEGGALRRGICGFRATGTRPGRSIPTSSPWTPPGSSFPPGGRPAPGWR